MVFRVTGATGAPSAQINAAIKAEQEVIKLEKRELSDFGKSLSTLRSNLKQLQQIGLEVNAEARRASISSSSSLDLATGDGDLVINTVANLSGISSGTFSVNGVDITVDITADTLNDVFSSIAAADTSARAALDAGEDFVTFRASSLSKSLVLDDGTSGFFTGTNVAVGTYKPKFGDPNLHEGSKIQKLLTEIGDTLDEIFDPEFEHLSAEFALAIQDTIKDGIKDSFGLVLSTTKNLNVLRASLGVDFDFTDTSRGIFKLDTNQFDRAFKNDFSDLNKFLFAENKGLTDSLISKLDELGKTSLDKLDPDLGPGFLVELKV